MTLKAAMDASAAAKDDAAWSRAADAAGLVSGGDRDRMGIDEEFGRAIDGDLALVLHHRCYDTSGPFSNGPDRTKLTLTIRRGAFVLDSYRVEWDSGLYS